MKTPISYYGGKQTLLKHILPLIPSHKLYTEAFCGGAAVLFAKRPADGEVINDISMDITNFYWMAKVYYRDLKQEIEKTLHSRDMHAHAGHILQYPQKLRNAKDEFTEWLCSRLDNVTIENRDALDVISTYDSPDTFHFVDPPYINSDCGHYEGTFDEYCMEKLLQLLEQVKGKFMLTMFPLPMIEEYANKNGWIIRRVERTISASKTSRRKQEEWMVCNYEEHPQRTLFDYKDSNDAS